MVTPLPMHTPSTMALGISHQPQLLLSTCSVATVQLVQAVSRQPALVPSLHLTSEACTLVLSPQLHQHVASWGVQGGSASVHITVVPSTNTALYS